MPSRSDAPFSSAAAELTTLEAACEEAAGAAEEAVEEETEEKEECKPAGAADAAPGGNVLQLG